MGYIRYTVLNHSVIMQEDDDKLHCTTVSLCASLGATPAMLFRVWAEHKDEFSEPQYDPDGGRLWSENDFLLFSMLVDTGRTHEAREGFIDILTKKNVH